MPHSVTFLLDVNVLMALLWENHDHHRTARRWLRQISSFATCPVTQLGFARVSSHPLLGYGMTPDQAFAILRRFIADSRHQFVPADLSCENRALRTEEIVSANQITDHYLAALARQHHMRLATMDQPLVRTFASEPNLVVLVS